MPNMKWSELSLTVCLFKCHEDVYYLNKLVLDNIRTYLGVIASQILRYILAVWNCNGSNIQID